MKLGVTEQKRTNTLEEQESNDRLRSGAEDGSISQPYAVAKHRATEVRSTGGGRNTRDAGGTGYPVTRLDKPRIELAGTLAEGQLDFTVWHNYERARRTLKADLVLGQVRDLFTGQALHNLEAQTSPKALDTYVVLTDKVRDRTAAAFRFDPAQQDRYGIVLNARYLFDPEQVAHVLAEETIHTQQYFDGVDFDTQDAQHLYEDRPYEIEAKQKATAILGYGYADIPHWKLRPEPRGLRKQRVPHLIRKRSRNRKGDRI